MQKRIYSPFYVTYSRLRKAALFSIIGAMITHRNTIPYTIVMGLILLLGFTTSTYWQDMWKLNIGKADATFDLTRKSEKKELPLITPAGQSPLGGANVTTTPTPTPGIPSVPEVAGIVVTPTPTPAQSSGFLFPQLVTPTPTPQGSLGGSNTQTAVTPTPLLQLNVPVNTSVTNGTSVRVESEEGQLLPKINLNLGL